MQLSGTHAWGGEDTVTATIVSRTAGRKQTALHEGAAPSRWDTGESRSYPVAAPSNDSIWPSSVSPAVHRISGRGCDDERMAVRVESFPSQQYELQLNVALFSEIVEQVNREIGEAFDRSFGPITIEPRIVGPTGTLSVKWGWKEHSDWRCCYAIEAQPDGLFFNPSIGWPGVTLSLTMSFRVGSSTVREDSVQWQPIQSATIWQPQNPFKLAGR